MIAVHDHYRINLKICFDQCLKGIKYIYKVKFTYMKIIEVCSKILPKGGLSLCMNKKQKKMTIAL